MATVLTNAGRAVLTGRLIGSTPSQAEPKYVAWGTAAGTAAVTTTFLFTEVSQTGASTGTRVTGTASQTTTSVTNDTYQVVATLTNTSGGALTVTNAGLADLATIAQNSGSGNFLIIGDFTGIPLANNDQIQFTFKLQFT